MKKLIVVAILLKYNSYFRIHNNSNVSLHIFLVVGGGKLLLINSVISFLLYSESSECI